MRVFLIRHAESINNSDKRSVYNMLSGLFSATLPSWDQIASLSRLLRIQMDTELSERGEEMLITQRNKLINLDFLNKEKVDLIIHSPLKRAVKTCNGLFGISDNIVEHPICYERDVMETIKFHDLSIRVDVFKDWLLNLNVNTVVIVGHGAFFRTLTNNTYQMDNCEIRRCELCENGDCVDLGKYLEGY